MPQTIRAGGALNTVMDYHTYDDFIDDDGNISLFSLSSRPRFPPDDPRYVSPSMRSQIAEMAFAQMKQQNIENLRLLTEAENLRPGK